MVKQKGIPFKRSKGLAKTPVKRVTISCEFALKNRMCRKNPAVNVVRKVIKNKTAGMRTPCPVLWVAEGKGMEGTEVGLPSVRGSSFKVAKLLLLPAKPIGSLYQA